MGEKQRNSKQDLLKKGMDILAAQGIERLTIDALCSALKVTKGSFYHHFKSLKNFRQDLLEFWMEENTERKKVLADQCGTELEQYARILGYAASLPHDQEKALRAWAMQDPQVAEYQARVDKSRTDYLAGLLEVLLPDPAQAGMAARIVLAAMIGSRHMFPPVLGSRREEMMATLHTFMGITLPPAKTKGEAQ